MNCSEEVARTHKSLEEHRSCFRAGKIVYENAVRVSESKLEPLDFSLSISYRSCNLCWECSQQEDNFQKQLLVTKTVHSFPPSEM